MKLIFMGTPEFAVPTLKRLLRDNHEVAAVFTQPDKPAGRGKAVHQPAVKQYALEHGIPVHQPARIKANDEVRSIMETISPDACIVAAYGKILPPWMLAIPRLGCINVHASLLPGYRGAAPINWAIANGEKKTGVTIMAMDVGMDTGAMYAKRSTAIGDRETAPELSARLAQLGSELLGETLPLIERGEITPVNQDDSLASYAPMLKREDGRIDWSMSAGKIADRVRAFQPWPGTFADYRDGKLIIWSAAARGTPHLDEVVPGTILDTDRSGVDVACGEHSILRIEEIQIEGKRRMQARDFLNGARLRPGDRLIHG